MEREWDPDADANVEKEEGRENNDLLEGGIQNEEVFFLAHLLHLEGLL